MSLYTTGEIAKLAGVSVRTVQFYDRKGILPPSQLSEGGRRLYSQEDLGKLQRICLWKTMGLSLEAIKGILESQNADKVLELLLEQQAKALEEDIQDRQQQLRSIRALEENLKSAEKIPVNSISDMEQLMKKQKKTAENPRGDDRLGRHHGPAPDRRPDPLDRQGDLAAICGLLCRGRCDRPAPHPVLLPQHGVPLSCLRRQVPAGSEGISLFQTHPQDPEAHLFPLRGKGLLRRGGCPLNRRRQPKKEPL